MSLFVGNISKNVRPFELEDNFNKYGKCTIKQKGSFAFIEYDDDRDAEEAKENLHDMNMGGLNIAIEWSKRSGHYNPKDSHRPPPRSTDSKCYNCNKIGHFARDCRSRRRSRSRSYDRDRGDRGYRGRGRDRSRSHSHERGRRSPERRYGGGHHRDHDRRDNDRRGRRSSRSGSFEKRRHHDRNQDRRDRSRSPVRQRGGANDRSRSKSGSPQQKRGEDRDMGRRQRSNSYDKQKKSDRGGSQSPRRQGHDRQQNAEDDYSYGDKMPQRDMDNNDHGNMHRQQSHQMPQEGEGK